MKALEVTHNGESSPFCGLWSKRLRTICFDGIFAFLFSTTRTLLLIYLVKYLIRFSQSETNEIKYKCVHVSHILSVTCFISAHKIKLITKGLQEDFMCLTFLLVVNAELLNLYFIEFG